MPSVTPLATALLLPPLAALSLIALGVRGRTRPTPPTCSRCRFNVSAQWPSAPSSPAPHTTAPAPAELISPTPPGVIANSLLYHQLHRRFAFSQPHFEIDGVHFDMRTHGGYFQDGTI